MTEELFTAEITKAQRPLYVYVCSLLGGSRGAGDVLQEVNLVLWRKRAEFDPGRPFLPWAYAIARFQVLAHVKKAVRDRHVFREDVLQDIAQRAQERGSHLDEQMEALDGCLEKLPSRQKQYVLLRYRQGLSIRQISERLSATENTVMVMLSRARAALTRCVEAMVGGRG